jgi:16S rRNA (guanine527-N7)-methyltransferase
MTPRKPLLDPYELIVQGCRILDIPLQDFAAHKMLHHMELVKKWGAKINLTAIEDPREMAILHFLDSLTVFKVIPVGSHVNVLDIGSGAGFPGLVLSTADETLRVTLLDRDPKKIVFLKYATHALNLTGVDFINMSLKNLLVHPSAGLFDRIVSRGFSSDTTVLDGLHSLLAPSGRLIIMTGPSSKRLALKNFRLTVFWEGFLPFSNRFRKVSLYQLNN